MRANIAKILESVATADLADDRTRMRMIKQLNEIVPAGAVFCAENYSNAVSSVMMEELKSFVDLVGSNDNGATNDTPQERRLALEQLIMDSAHGEDEYGTGVQQISKLVENYHVFLGKLADHHKLVTLHTVVATYPELVMPYHFPHVLDDAQAHTITVAFAGHEERAGSNVCVRNELKAALN